VAAQILLAADFGLPARAVTESLAVLGRKGGGKTNTGGVLFEQMHMIGAQCVALDPVGNWWGLRLSASGKRKGLDIPVFGGVHGDVPLTPTSGKLIAQLVVDRRVSCVIDLMTFKPEQRRLFAADFAEELFELKKTHRSPLHLFVEEARKFIPQLSKSKLDLRMADAFDDIVRLGRNYGLGVSLLDQRPQSVNKEVLSQTEILIVHQLTETHGRKAIEDWVRSKTTKGGEQLADLDQLEVGEAFVWSPGLLRTFARVRVQKKQTYDASATPELGSGQEDVAPRPLDATDLTRLEAAMTEVVAEAAATDPTKLRQEVQRLRAQVATLEVRAPAPAPPAKEVRVAVMGPEDWERLDKYVERLDKEVKLLDQQRDKLAQAQQVVTTELGNIKTLIMQAAATATSSRGTSSTATSSPTTTASRPTGSLKVVYTDKPTQRVQAAGAAGVALTGPEQRVLEALAWQAAIGIHEADSTTTAFLAGYKVGGAYNNVRGKLRSAGLVDYPTPGTLKLTLAGAAAAPAVLAPLTTAALHEHVMARLEGPHRRLLAPLLEAYPESLTTTELAAASGYEIGGAFNNARGRLRSMGLADYPTTGSVRATDRLFLKR
jgi:hypothetical protein